ncbi:MAG: iron-containing alcohol dehydrogenase [bacterium]|nr:iron-containing alcohol dehydrogenase [bacterium]
MKDLLGKKFKCNYCKDIHKVEIEDIRYGNLDEFCKILDRNTNYKKLLILCDNITWEVAGKKIKENIKNNISIPLILKPKNEKRVTANYFYIEEIKKNIEKIDIILTVGSGTITDMGKFVGDKYKIPVISFPTAPSMNGYTSPVCAYIKDGVKITIPVKPCKYVYIDENIICNAPIELIKSGFADSLAKSFANADWKISSIITGEKFCTLPFEVVSSAEKKYINKGSLILKRDKKVIKNLMDGLNLGGISMIIAGSSSPASGGEHLISHFLDMYACQRNIEPFSYHGLQVGTGIFLSALIYENIKKISCDEISKKLNKIKIDYDEKLNELIYLFPSSEKKLKEIFENKIKITKKLREKLPEKWSEIKNSVCNMVYSSSKIKNYFKKVSCPLHLKEICDNKSLINKAIKLSRFIRERIVIFDIADEIGLLNELTEEYLKM